MKTKNNSKELLIEYLLSKPGIDISREEIIAYTGISKSRLSELINDIRSDGYKITTPNRSGIVKLELSESIKQNVTSKEIRQWLIILALSKLGTATYLELICSILSIADSTYLYELFSTDDNYSDMSILTHLKKYNSAIKDDIDQFLSLPTLRKDLHSLYEIGYIAKKRVPYKSGIHVIYSLSEKAPAILFESGDELFSFMNFYDNFKNSLSNTAPLESLYQKITDIYDWESFENSIQIYGKSNQIDKNQLKYLNKFLQYPYKTKSLFIRYKSKNKETSLSINTGLLFYSIETNCFYILCKKNKKNRIVQLRLDRIVSISEDSSKNIYYGSPEIIRIYEEMFSASYDAQKSHVKVLFEEFGNITERLQTLHAKRKCSRLYKLPKPIDGIPHSMVYEDELRGLSAFSRYLRSFGRCALVVEPQELQDLMIQSTTKTLNNYGVYKNEFIQ